VANQGARGRYRGGYKQEGTGHGRKAILKAVLVVYSGERYGKEASGE
jgi:hypothetical protein